MKNAEDAVAKVPKRVKRRIKVAVLDTGIDWDNSNLIEYRKRIKFLDGDETTNKDTDGHGTLVAYLLLRLAPNTEIWVSKISESRKFELGAARLKALEQASKVEADCRMLMLWADVVSPQTILNLASDPENKIDILNLSFGFSNDDNPLLGPLEAALQEAHIKHKILILAAARNDAGNASVAWPAAMIDHVICVNASTDGGDDAKINPTQRSPKISTLGLGFELSFGDTFIRESGTSFATPIASALVATILDFAHRNHEAFRQFRGHSKLRTRRGMMNVLTFMCTNPPGQPRGEYFYVKHDFFLNQPDAPQARDLVSRMVYIMNSAFAAGMNAA